jgi:beta-ribofuranosylaminobenzene 5'-phosphate synthase
MEVTMRTPSRLHFAMVDLRGDLGRLYGSVGVAIDRPNIVLKARPATHLTVEGPSAERAKDYAEKFLEGFGVEGGAEIAMISDIRAHVGFGSGTQLALAVGTALSELHELGLTTEEIAQKLERSRRSGIGTYAFKHGGFIVDGGHRKDQRDAMPPLIFHSDVPEDWLFVIGLPDIANDRSGKVENDVFKRVEPPPAGLIGEISRIVLVKMIPAMIERDIDAFGSAMTSIDFKFGEFWLEIQGGRFSHPLIEEGVNFLLEAGAHGVGQSSWGPAFYGLVRGESDAEIVSERLRGFLNSGGRRGESFVARPDNGGAVVTVSDV